MNIALDKSRKFAIRIYNLYKHLCEDKREYVLSKQILRSGTSIGANLSEAQYAVSKKEFLVKATISLIQPEKAYLLFSFLIFHSSFFIRKNP
jgi:four helix bundle protein